MTRTYGIEFELLPDHVKLIRAMNIGWSGVECGAPCVEPKCPYGNGDLTRSIYEILVGGDWDIDHHMPADLTPKMWADLEERFRKLHEEMETALQVVLASGSFEPRVYTRTSEYSRDWVLS